MHHRGDGALEQMPLLCEAFSSPQAELVMMPLLCSQNRGYNCPFLLSFPPQTCPELLLLSSAVSLWKILHPACSRCSINDNIPHTHQNHSSMHGSLYCQVLLSSPSPLSVLMWVLLSQSPCGILTGNLPYFSEKQHSRSKLLLSKSRVCVCGLYDASVSSLS